MIKMLPCSTRHVTAESTTSHIIDERSVNVQSVGHSSGWPSSWWSRSRWINHYL